MAKRFRVVISGPRLLMHNGRMSDKLDPYTKELARVTNKCRGKDVSDDALIEKSRVEFQGGLYHEDDIGPYMPNESLQQAMVQGGRQAKKGKEFVAVEIEEDLIPLEYDGPRGRDALWEQHAKFALSVQARVGASRVTRTRPMFTNWTLKFHVLIEDDAKINPEEVQEALQVAGRRVGIGDWRPGSPRGGRYGRFMLKTFEEVENV